jgi:acetylornithine/N-succinyldiaminopimelate aminotransferase
MKLFDVYPLFNITPVKAEGCYVWDSEGNKYLDLYGGHAVISIGHSHPHYVSLISEQLKKIGFYSNSIQNPLQQELADKLGNLSVTTITSFFYATRAPKPTKMPLSWLHLLPAEKIHQL